MDIMSDYYLHMKEIYDEDPYDGIACQEVHIPYYLNKYGIMITNETFEQKFNIVRNIIRN